MLTTTSADQLSQGQGCFLSVEVWRGKLIEGIKVGVSTLESFVKSVIMGVASLSQNRHSKADTHLTPVQICNIQ